MILIKTLSSRVNRENGMSEVLLRLSNGAQFDARAKSGIFVTPDNFKNGEIAPNRRKVGNDVVFHEAQKKRLAELCTVILDEAQEAAPGVVNTSWLKKIVDNFHHPKTTDGTTPFSELMQIYITKKDCSTARKRTLGVVMRSVLRYVCYRQEIEHEPGFTFNVDKVTRDDVEGLVSYLRNEKALAEEYPQHFARMLQQHPDVSKRSVEAFTTRSDNYLANFTKALKAFFHWLNDEGVTKNRPFEGYKIKAEEYGTPFYITIEERNHLAAFDLTGCKSLEAQRDIFIFQCLVGCRVGDLMRLTDDNVQGGILVYTPHKTKEKNNTQARVPLLPQALALIEKYHGKDTQGRLFPFISPQKYNDMIKEAFTRAGLDRKVLIRNPHTGQEEFRPINEIASSHMARRTFVGNIYFNVTDPNIIAKMSGHVEGSKAFARYRKIEDATLMGVVSMLG